MDEEIKMIAVIFGGFALIMIVAAISLTLQTRSDNATLQACYEALAAGVQVTCEQVKR